jgi:hypothetical protein
VAEMLTGASGPGEWAARLAKSSHDLGDQIRLTFLTRAIARQIRYSHRGRSLSGPGIQTRAALLAAKLAPHAGAVINVRL